jgi:phosphate starvation-inducible PhoH-like protein
MERLMGKRSSHAALAIRLAEVGPAADPAFAEGEREQSYRRRVRPQSDGQGQLMAAIEHHNLTIALGPAGTGKTYLESAPPWRRSRQVRSGASS